jgi:hypothetical protein
MFGMNKYVSIIIFVVCFIVGGQASAEIGQKADCLVMFGGQEPVSGRYNIDSSGLWSQQKPSVLSAGRGFNASSVWRKDSQYFLDGSPANNKCNLDRDDNYIIKSGQSITISGDVEVGNIIVEEGGELILTPGSRLNLNRTADPIRDADYNASTAGDRSALLGDDNTMGLLHVKGKLSAAGAVIYEGEIVSVSYRDYDTDGDTDGILLVLDPAPRNMTAGYSMYLRVLDDDPVSLTTTITDPVQIGEGSKERDKARASYAKWRQYKVWKVSGNEVTLAYNEHENINLGKHWQGSDTWQDEKYVVGTGTSTRCINGSASWPDVTLGANATASGLTENLTSASAASCFGAYMGQRGMGHTTTAAPENVNATWVVTNSSYGLYSTLLLDQTNNRDRYGLNDMGKAYVRWNGVAATAGAAKASCDGKHAKVVGIQDNFDSVNLADLSTASNRNDYLYVSGDVTGCNGVQWEFTDGLRAGDRVAGINAAVIKGNVREKATGSAAAKLDWESNFRGFNGRIAIDHKTAVVKMEHVVIRYIDAADVCSGSDCWVKEIPATDSNGDWTFSGLPMVSTNASTSATCVLCLYNSDPKSGNKASESSYRWVDIGFVHHASVGPPRVGAIFGLIGTNPKSGHAARWNVDTLWDVTGMDMEYLYIHDVIVTDGNYASIRGWNPTGVNGGSLQRTRIERTDGSQYSSFNFNPINVDGLDTSGNAIECPTCKGVSHKDYHVITLESRPEVVIAGTAGSGASYHPSSACAITYDYDATTAVYGVDTSGGRNASVAAYGLDTLNTGTAVSDLFAFGCANHGVYVSTTGGNFRNLVTGGPTDFSFNKGVSSISFNEKMPNKVSNSLAYIISATRGEETNEEIMGRVSNYSVAYLSDSIMVGSPGPAGSVAPFSTGLRAGKGKNWQGVFSINGAASGMFSFGRPYAEVDATVGGGYTSFDYSDSVFVNKDLEPLGPFIASYEPFTGNNPYGDGYRRITFQNNYLVGGTAAKGLADGDMSRFNNQCGPQGVGAASSCKVLSVTTVDNKTQIKLDHSTGFVDYPLEEGQQVAFMNLPPGRIYTVDIIDPGSAGQDCGAADGTYDFQTWGSIRYGLATGANLPNDVKGKFTVVDNVIQSVDITDNGQALYRGSPLFDVMNSEAGATDPVSGNTACNAIIWGRGGMSDLEMKPSPLNNNDGGGGWGRFQAIYPFNSGANQVTPIQSPMTLRERPDFRRSLFTITNLTAVTPGSSTTDWTFNLKWTVGADAGEIVNVLGIDECDNDTADTCVYGARNAMMISGYPESEAGKLVMEVKDSTITYSDATAPRYFYDPYHMNTGNGARVDGPLDAGRNVTNTLVVGGEPIGGWGRNENGSYTGIGPAWEASSGSAIVSNSVGSLARAYIEDEGSVCTFSGNANAEIASTITGSVSLSSSPCATGCFSAVGGGGLTGRFKGTITGGVLVDAWVWYGGAGYSQEQTLTLAAGEPVGLSCATYPVVKATVKDTSLGILRGTGLQDVSAAAVAGTTPARLRDFLYTKDGSVMSTSRPRKLGLSAMAVSHALLGDFFVEQWDNFSSSDYISSGGGGGGSSDAW